MPSLEIPDAPISSESALDRFLQWVDQSALTLYAHQESAILELFEGKNVLLNTPTGSGKSLVALALHFRGLCLGRKTYYTVPVKALANEKFLSLCQTFGAKKVGLITGDASVNAEAPILCCTAEIVANIALREGANAPIDDLIMDEFHYYSDRERGIAWQIPLLTLSQTRFCLMSATMGETARFERELTDLTGAQTVLVHSDQRPVPLEFDYSQTPLEEKVAELVSADKAPIYLVHFTQNSTAQSASNLASQSFLTREERSRITEALIGVKFNSPYGKDLRRLLASGIGVHHAGLLPRYRILVERLAQQGLLKVICGTDTLGVGVNVPIRTVLFTQLCKYDGQKTTILTVRDFQQICGRAGRRGFDTTGYVTAQAPAHEIENQVAQKKAALKAAKGKKGKAPIKKRAPEHGYTPWNESTYRRLIESPPEPLTSSFRLRQSMVLQLLSRTQEDGCMALQQLIARSHQSGEQKKALRKRAFQLFRGLVESQILSVIPPAQRTTRGPKLLLNIALQDDFSLNQSLGLWLLETLPKLDREHPTYSLQVLSLIEAILEDPSIILRAQTKRERSHLAAQLKEEGVGYEERAEQIEAAEYPKPGKDFIYDTYNDFVAKNPWLKEDAIRPKSIARELFEDYLDFPDYIRTYHLERTEGVLLRHLSEVYKVLTQTVPPSAVTPELEQAREYLEAIVEHTDSSLLDEWKTLENPHFDPEKEAAKQRPTRQNAPLSQRKKEWTRLVHNEVLRFLKFFRQESWEACLELIEPTNEAGERWDKASFEASIDQYLEEHPPYLLDPEARNERHHHVRVGQREDAAGKWFINQVLCDPDMALTWVAQFTVDLQKSDAAQCVHLVFEGLQRSDSFAAE